MVGVSDVGGLSRRTSVKRDTLGPRPGHDAYNRGVALHHTAADVSLYQLQKAIYQYLNPKKQQGAPSLTPEDLHTRYTLTEEEARAVLDADVRALHHLGVHPVLLNSYARARVPREQYRAILAVLDAATSQGLESASSSSVP
jgi:hypothetical protein